MNIDTTKEWIKAIDKANTMKLTDTVIVTLLMSAIPMMLDRLDAIQNQVTELNNRLDGVILTPKEDVPF